MGQGFIFVGFEQGRYPFSSLPNMNVKLSRRTHAFKSRLEACYRSWL